MSVHGCTFSKQQCVAKTTSRLCYALRGSNSSFEKSQQQTGRTRFKRMDQVDRHLVAVDQQKSQICGGDSLVKQKTYFCLVDCQFIVSFSSWKSIDVQNQRIILCCFVHLDLALYDVLIDSLHYARTCSTQVS